VRVFRSEPWLAALLMLAALSYAYRVGRIALKSPFPDFRVMFRSAQALHQDRSLYDVDRMSQEPFAAHYKYPPLFATLLEPLRPLGFRRAARVWLLVLQACYFGAFAVLCRAFGLRFRSLRFYVAFITVLVFQPSIDSFWNGQVDAPLLLMLAGAWAALATGREVRAGALVALAGILKVYPAFMASFLLLRRRWRALTSFVVSVLLLVAVSVLLAGWGAHREFVARVLPVNAATTAWVENQSLSGLFARFFVDGRIGGPGKETVVPAATVLGAVAGVAVLAATFLAGLRTSRERSLFGALLSALLLVLPVAWIHYEVLLLLPLFDLLAQPFDGANGGAVQGALLAAAALLLAFGNQHLVLRHPWVPQSFKLLGVLLIWALEMHSLRPWRAPQAG
jgi:glycosyl transferase family 87